MRCCYCHLSDNDLVWSYEFSLWTHIDCVKREANKHNMDAMRLAVDVGAIVVGVRR